MSQDPRLPAIRRLLFNFVRSPSLRHLRDTHSIEGLAEDIIRSLGEDRPTWRKWDTAREEFLKSAAQCWIPVEDLRDYLNGMPGPKLTNTDVAQRLQVHYVEPYVSFPDEDLQAGCLAIYETEKAEGTELPAIVGALQEYIEKEEDRLRIEQRAAREKYIEDERIALEMDAHRTIKRTVLPDQRQILSTFADGGQNVEPPPNKIGRGQRGQADRKISAPKGRHQGSVASRLST
jgi:hypothetical protein